MSSVINLDQDNGNGGTNNPGDPGQGAACGPRQLNSFGLQGQLTFIVANGGSTWNHFRVPDATAGAELPNHSPNLRVRTSDKFVMLSRIRV